MATHTARRFRDLHGEKCRLKRRMLVEARRRHGSITPCGTRTHLFDCFEFLDDRLYLWFNTGDGTTHLLGEQSLRGSEEPTAVR